jgi:TfoX/Sxy family transcriptional regulator of competence genes
MAYNDELTNRVREALADLPNVEEKKMFGGVGFMLNGKLCFGVESEELLCRIDPDLQEEVAEMPRVKPMIKGNQTMKGYVFVHEDVLKNQKDFDYWINLALQYNHKAPVSKKKQKKA